MNRISFRNTSDAPEGPGLYEVYTKSGVALKVGIAANLRRRLIQHANSLQSRLRLVDGGNWATPAHVRSKQSILAKHLYFDRTLGGEYDLTTEEGRRSFLANECIVKYLSTATRDAARELERKLEAKATYRYLGRARVK